VVTDGTFSLHAFFDRTPDETGATLRAFRIRDDPLELRPDPGAAIPGRLFDRMTDTWTRARRLRKILATGGPATVPVRPQTLRDIRGLGYVAGQ